MSGLHWPTLGFKNVNKSSNQKKNQLQKTVFLDHFFSHACFSFSVCSKFPVGFFIQRKKNTDTTHHVNTDLSDM